MAESPYHVAELRQVPDWVLREIARIVTEHLDLTGSPPSPQQIRAKLEQVG